MPSTDRTPELILHGGHIRTQDETGWLGVGRLADLVVLDRELGAPYAGPIGETRVVATMVGGEFVFESPALEAG